MIHKSFSFTTRPFFLLACSAISAIRASSAFSLSISNLDFRFTGCSVPIVFQQSSQSLEEPTADRFPKTCFIVLLLSASTTWSCFEFFISSALVYFDGISFSFLLYSLSYSNFDRRGIKSCPQVTKVSCYNFSSFFYIKVNGFSERAQGSKVIKVLLIRSLIMSDAISWRSSCQLINLI